MPTYQIILITLGSVSTLFSLFHFGCDCRKERAKNARLRLQKKADKLLRIIGGLNNNE